MIQNKTKLLSAAALLLILTLPACSGGQSQPAASGSGPSASESQDTLDQSLDAAQREAALYIGTKEKSRHLPMDGSATKRRTVVPGQMLFSGGN